MLSFGGSGGIRVPAQWDLFGEGARANWLVLPGEAETRLFLKSFVAHQFCDYVEGAEIIFGLHT
jgi:hypothetical protein